jgi:hypothetical protein
VCVCHVFAMYVCCVCIMCSSCVRRVCHVSFQLPITDIRLLKALSPDQVEVGATVRAIFSGDGLYYDAIVKKVRDRPCVHSFCHSNRSMPASCARVYGCRHLTRACFVVTRVHVA